MVNVVREGTIRDGDNRPSGAYKDQWRAGMRATAEMPIRSCLNSFGRIAALCVCAVTAGCALIEGAASPATNTRVMLRKHEVVEVSRVREEARNYHCLEGVLMCDDGSVTQWCHCSTSGMPVLR
jgi:hypothetical protein